MAREADANETLNDYEGIGEAAALMETVRAGTLATLDAETGFPLATLVTTALDRQGMPLILISELAVHTRNIRADPRFSLLLVKSGKGDPLAHARVTLIGSAVPAIGGETRETFVTQNPKAKLYAGFTDFSLWRLVPDRIHLNGGFGKTYAGAAEPVLARLRSALAAKP